MAARLKVYNEFEEFETAYAPEPAVHVRLKDLIPLVEMAHRRNFTWLKDFLEDEVAISDDLYDVLQNFSRVRPGA